MPEVEITSKEAFDVFMLGVRLMRKLGTKKTALKQYIDGYYKH